MNRVILIGNGFDLAHDFKTDYKSFIDDYWLDEIKSINAVLNKRSFKNGFFELINLPFYTFEANNYSEFKLELQKQNCTITFFNNFLKLISEKASLDNWSGIESEYYFQLKEVLKNQHDNSRKALFKGIKELNDNFEEIKNLLIVYLRKIESDKIKMISLFKQDLNNELFSYFDIDDFEEAYVKQRIDAEIDFIKNIQHYENIDIGKYLNTSISNLINREVYKVKKAVDFIASKSGNVDHTTVKNALFAKNTRDNYFDLIPDSILFLSFNYTSISDVYARFKRELIDTEKNVEVKTIKIHGDYQNRDNPVIFGFGDELDQDYHEIERVNDNRYLENIKSIKYLESRNYKELIEFIGSDYFQVFVVGHSCGLSDRTLLSTIFEHQNCASIKVFYYENGGSDNYSDVIRNISRSFRDKMKMRERVVNKSNSKPLPKA